ncbi:MAG: DUF432 domain-containing protein [Opitutales bacterium]|nr:DUF432 domain-containing protein [Opitutales bacterium]
MKSIFADPREIPEGKTGLFSLGPLQIRVRRQNHDWLTLAKRDPEADHPSSFILSDETSSHDDTWTRYAFREEEEGVSLIPAFPDRSLVVRPKSPLQLPPKNKVTFYVSIPLWVRLQFGEKTPVTVENLPTVILSNTWFGLPTEGELCYALKTSAVRDLSLAQKGDHRAICPLTVKNESEEVFPITKLSLPTNYLGLYQGTTRWWTNPMEILHLGPNRPGTLRPLNTPPSYEQCGKQLLPPVKKPKEDLVHRTFSGFRSLFY